MSDLPPLFHYTCPHGRIRIGTAGLLLPGLDRLVWLTDLDVAHADALGLSSVLIECDRTKHRYRVTDAADVRSWLDVRGQIDPLRVAAIEQTPGVLVRHWYVSRKPVPAELDDPAVRR